MEEGQTTIDGTTYTLPRPFLVVATQNPVEMEGTYPLPEAQRDRFMARLTVGYPDNDAELLMLDRQEAATPLAHLRPVTTGAAMTRYSRLVRAVHAAPPVKQYVLDLVGATRGHQAKARAAISGREHVLPDDVQVLARPVLAHRLILSTESRLAGRSAEQLVDDVVQRIPVPATAGRR
jgi:MoxR-like ATPase